MFTGWFYDLYLVVFLSSANTLDPCPVWIWFHLKVLRELGKTNMPILSLMWKTVMWTVQNDSRRFFIWSWIAFTLKDRRHWVFWPFHFNPFVVHFLRFRDCPLLTFFVVWIDRRSIIDGPLSFCTVHISVSNITRDFLIKWNFPTSVTTWSSFKLSNFGQNFQSVA